MKRLLSVLTGAAIAGSFSMLPVSAETSAEDFLSLLKTKPEDTFEIVMPEEAVFADQVGKVTSGSLQGLAVTCADLGATLANGIGEIAVTWSEGKWSSVSIPKNTCRMQPIAGFAACYGKTGEYEYVSGSEYVTYTISADLTGTEETVYLLTAPLELVDDEMFGSYWANDYSELLSAVLADENLKLLGAVYGMQTSVTVYQCGGNAVIKLADETKQIPEELFRYGFIEPYYNDYYLLETDTEKDGVEFSDMLKLCDEIAQIEGIEIAYPAGVTPETIADSVAGFSIELVQYDSGNASEPNDAEIITTTEMTDITLESEDISTTTETTNITVESENITTTTETTDITVESEDITTTTEATDITVESEDITTVNTDGSLPQTGNNSITKILVVLGALLLTGAGTWTVYESHVFHRKREDEQ